MERETRPLLIDGRGVGLVQSVKFLHNRGDWFCRLFLVMPDHVHALVSVPPDTSLALRVAAWKGFTAKKLGIAWQERFFDHRLRSEETLDEKAHYIRMNPVRAGLVVRCQDWPFVFDAFAIDGSAGTPRPTC